MKYLILSKKDKRIMHISDTLSYNKSGVLILDNELHIAPNFCIVVEVDKVPEWVEPEKYCYINNEYLLNEQYKENKKNKLLRKLYK